MKAVSGSQALNGYFNFFFSGLFSSKTLICMAVNVAFVAFAFDLHDIFPFNGMWMQTESLGPFDLGLSSSRKVINGDNTSINGIVR